MPTFTVSLIASVPISATVVIDADNADDAVKIANQMQTRTQLQWTFNGLPMPTFTGTPDATWASQGVVAPPGPKKSTLVLNVNPNVVTFGTPVALSANVTPGATGSIQFFNGLTLLGAATPNSHGVALLPSVAFPVGLQQITARFLGDLYLASSTSNTVTVTVNQVATTTTLVSTPNPQNVGQPVRFQASVISGLSIPSGLVVFLDGSMQIGASIVDGQGNAVLNINTLSVGSHAITATYQGNADYSPSTSPSLSQTIQ